MSSCWPEAFSISAFFGVNIMLLTVVDPCRLTCPAAAMLVVASTDERTTKISLRIQAPEIDLPDYLATAKLINIPLTIFGVCQITSATT
jgi:hypothetical protein